MKFKVLRATHNFTKLFWK